MFVDYYKLLEIDISVSQSEIKSAFRRQALKWHPDTNPGIDTTEMMQQINEAYLILKDIDARERYDIEYKRFKEYNKEQKETNSQGDNINHEKENTNFESYEFFDQTLKNWVQNARKQAKTLVEQTIEDFRGMSAEGGRAIGESIISGIIRYIVIGVIMLVIFKTCN